jgi:hypothetical protein
VTEAAIDRLSAVLGQGAATAIINDSYDRAIMDAFGGIAERWG